MSEVFRCGDTTALVGYLYDECGAEEHAAIGAHVALCAACAAEVATLESARGQLAAWTPPDADLGFAVVRTDVVDEARGTGRRETAGRWWPAPAFAWPAWAHAIAACLIFGVGLTLGILRGAAPAPGADAAAAAPATAAAPAGAPEVVSPADLAALERRLHAEIAQLRAAPAATSAPGMSEAQLLARVRALIDESEQRQQRALALRTAQVVSDFDLQRRMDLAEIQRGFGQIEGLTGAEVREQRQLLNYLMRVSGDGR